MKKAILTIMLVLSVCVCFSACKSQGSDNTQSNSDDTQANQSESDSNSYSSAAELADAFLETCKDKDIEKMYGLYYDDMLNATYDRIKDKVSKESFEAMIIDEMGTINEYKLYEYGCEELPSTVSPLYYVNYIHYGATGSDTDFEESSVTDCANLRVYKTDGSFSDHMLAEIDGSWYVTN